MRKIALLVISACTLLSFSRANAQNDPLTDVGFRGWGPRVGITMNPDQVHFGAHVDFGNFAEHVRFQPNVEVGIGDNLFVVALNAEAAYRFASQWDVWTPYLGGGIGINFVSLDEDVAGVDNSSTNFGLNLLGGIEKGLANGHRFFVEGKLGLADAPDFKATVGWTFFH